jgi:hypothetical protein
MDASQLRVKHPRIAHLPWSGHADDGDLRTTSVSTLVGREVVVLEKRDGENTTLYCDHHHARSVMSGAHPSRSKISALHAAVAAWIAPDMRICGENVSAVHSLRYHALRSIFEVFSAWRGDMCLGWDNTEELAHDIGLSVVPVLWRGTWDDALVRSIDVTRLAGDPCEGYVVRPAGSFTASEFADVVLKLRAVRVTSDEHWMHKRVEWNCVAGLCSHGKSVQPR